MTQDNVHNILKNTVKLINPDLGVRINLKQRFGNNFDQDRALGSALYFMSGSQSDIF